MLGRGLPRVLGGHQLSACCLPCASQAKGDIKHIYTLDRRDRAPPLLWNPMAARDRAAQLPGSPRSRLEISMAHGHTRMTFCGQELGRSFEKDPLFGVWLLGV